MDKTEVSNRQFSSFVEQTQYITEAENFGWSFVFEDFVSPELSATITQAVQGAEWWLPVPNATWRHPEGLDSNLDTALFVHKLNNNKDGMLADYKVDHFLM
jgi:formylglycine-generating enzyme